MLVQLSRGPAFATSDDERVFDDKVQSPLALLSALLNVTLNRSGLETLCKASAHPGTLILYPPPIECSSKTFAD